MTSFTVQKNDENQTIFKFIKKSYSTTPISVIYKWFRKSDIKLNGKRISDQKIILKENDEIVVYDNNKPVKRNTFKIISFKHLKIIYEDANILIIDKDFNVEVHSTINDSLDDMVKSYLLDKKEYDPENENTFVISHVHRLDKLTSGLVIYVKNKVALDILNKAIKEKDDIEKYYLLKTSNNVKSDFVAKGYIYYDSNEQKAFFSLDEENSAKTCETHFKVLDKNILEARLITGRKHQIRATLEYYNLSILNDFRYGGVKLNSEKMIYLKAYKLVFINLPEPLSYLNHQTFKLKPIF